MIDIHEYEQLAADSKVFQDIELQLLKEALLSWKTSPGAPYWGIELRDGRLLAGFAILHRSANTDFTFDVMALCMDEGYRDKGVGKGLLGLLETEVLKQEASAILRFETSTLKQEAMDRELLPSSGYALLGHIADFYKTGDDFYIYARHLLRPRLETTPKAILDNAKISEITESREEGVRK